MVHAGIIALRSPALLSSKRSGHCVFVGTITGLLRHNTFLRDYEGMLRACDPEILTKESEKPRGLWLCQILLGTSFPENFNHPGRIVVLFLSGFRHFPGVTRDPGKSAPNSGNLLDVVVNREPSTFLSSERRILSKNYK